MMRMMAGSSTRNITSRCSSRLLVLGWVFSLLLLLCPHLSINCGLLLVEATADSSQCQAGDENGATCDNTDMKKKPSAGESSGSGRGDDDDDGGDGGGSVWKIPKYPGKLARQSVRKGQSGYGTKIQSNFIQDVSLLKELTDHKQWFNCYETTRGSHTHWLPANQVPTTLFERVAIEMWKDQPIVKELQKSNKLAGYEIWCNILTPEGPLVWHIDKDQIAYQESNQQNVTLPYYGSVFYGYPHDFEGGYLELVAEDFHDDDPIDPTKVERIAAEYNRLVIFNASQFHRVSPILSGARVTLAVNIWKHTPQVAYMNS